MRRLTGFFLIFLFLLTMTGCERPEEQTPPASAGPAAAEPEKLIASVEIYNRTGKIQREDYYRTDAGKSVLDYSIEYSYTDSGRISTIRKNGGTIGENKAIESYLYSGDNCTQRVIYDANGSTKTVYYWSYQKNRLVSERVVNMIPSENGYSYSGREEILTEYNEDGTAKTKKRTAPEDYETDEYEYDEAGRLVTDRYSHSSDGETYRLFETRLYLYDGEGRLIRETDTDALGNTVYTKILEYNDAGNILSETEYSSGEIKDDNIQGRKVYEYTEGQMLNAMTEYAGNETIQTFYEYNSAGRNTVTTVQHISEGKPPERTVTTVEYDERQNPIRETVRDPDGTITVQFLCAYDYYNDGKIMNKTNYAV